MGERGDEKEKRDLHLVHDPCIGRNTVLIIIIVSYRHDERPSDHCRK